MISLVQLTLMIQSQVVTSINDISCVLQHFFIFGAYDLLPVTFVQEVRI